MEKIHTCAAALVPFFEQVFNGNWQQAERHCSLIFKMEEEADDLKRDIRLHLPSSLFLAISRLDVLGLLTQQDKIANKAKHIAGIVFDRKMQFPTKIKTEFASFVQRSVDAAALAMKAINELDELVETGFRGHEVAVVEEMVLELDQVERDTDKMQLQIRQQIFSLEKSLDPVDVIFLYKVIDWTAELADRAQFIGQRLESLLAS